MTKEQYIEYAKEILATHVYTELANTPKLVAWNCQRPNSSCYGFDILITRYGIAIVGDIDNLTFRVGLSYGLEFLAGSDLGYYIHSKLDQHCKDRELDENAVLDFCRRHWLEPLQELISEWLKKDGEDQERRQQLIAALAKYGIKDAEQIAWIDDEKAIKEIKSLDELRKIFYGIWRVVEGLLVFISEQRESFDLFEIHEAIEKISDTNNEHSLYEIIGNAPEGHMEMSDWGFTKPSQSLIQNLYIVNQAAKAILQQIATSKENQTEGTAK